MVDFQYKDSYGVKDLEEIVRLLRAPAGALGRGADPPVHPPQFPGGGL